MPESKPGPRLLELQQADWERTLRTNLTGTFLCSQRAARWMQQNGGGGIINIGSGANKTPFPNLVDYGASKGGIEMLTRVSAVELGPLGIRVNCVAPGAIEIERTKLEAPDYAGHVGADHTAAPHRYGRRRRPGRGLPGQPSRLLCDGANHLCRRRPVQPGPVAVFRRRGMNASLRSTDSALNKCADSLAA